MGAKYTYALGNPKGSSYKNLSALLKLLSKHSKAVATSALFGIFLTISTIFLSLTAEAQQSVQVLWPLTNDSEAVYSSGIGSASFKAGPALKNFRYDSINGATASGWNGKSLDPNAYYEYTISPERDATITINQLKFEVSLSSVNMRTALYYSKDGFSKQSIPVGNPVFVGKKSSRDLLVETNITVTYPETLTIRIYGWSAPNPAVNFFNREVQFDGVTVEPKPEIVTDNGNSGNRSTTVSQTFTTSGTFVVPANVYSLTVECWGGGGGGGTTDPQASGGGGGGAYSSGTFSVTPGTSYPYVVGSGGTRGVNGGNTTFGGTIVVATGGGAGQNGGVGGTGGQASASTGTVKYNGGNGGDRQSQFTAGGGGGGSATSTGNGGNGAQGAGGIGGNGGVGQGNGGNGGNDNFPGNPGFLPGGGGGGGGQGGATALSAAGAGGQVTITYCVSPTITLGSVPAVCAGVTSTTLPYTATTSSPDVYSIVYSAAALAAGFVNVPYTTLPASPVPIIVPAGAAPGSYSGTIYVQNTTTGCSSTGNTFTVTINPVPVLTVNPTVQTRCSGTPTSISVSTTLAAVSTISWTVSMSGVTGASNGSGSSPLTIAQTLTCTGSTPGTATYTIVSSTPSCTSAPVTVVVTVNPIPDVSFTPPGQTICSGETTAINLTSSVSGTTFSWTVAQVNVTGGSASSGNVIAQTLNATTSVPGTATYTVTPSASSCSGLSKQTTVTVKPVPTVSANPATQNNCPGKPIDPIIITNPNGVTGTSYSWIRDVVPGLTGLESGTGSPISGIINTSAPNTLLTTVFTITATANGCSSITTASVRVGDLTNPTITCPVTGTQNVTTNTSCTYVHSGTSWNATALDNCTINTLTYTLSGATTGTGGSLAGVAFNTGTTTVTWTATDFAAHSVSCSFDVTVTDDDPPVITCPGNKTAGTDNTVCTYTHSGTAWDATATDNCTASPSITWVLSGATTGSGNTTLNGVTFNRGSTTVIWTATDAAGLSVSCSNTVIISDDDLPVILCVGNQSVTTNVNCTYVHSGTSWNATATDNCSITSITYNLSGATTGTGTSLNNVAFNNGVTTVNWTATDVQGNSVSCTFTVTVTDDDAPSITCTGNKAVNTNTACQYLHSGTAWNASVTENCGTYTLTYTLSGATTGTGTNLSGVLFNTGITTVTWTATDVAGNSVTCQFTVTVTDATAPVVTCPTPAASYNNTPGQCGASLSFTATATDNCPGVTIKYYIGATEITFPYLFPVGTTTVTVRATDASGNVSPQCQFNVVVVDAELPTISCLGGVQNRNANNGGCNYTVSGAEFDPLSFADNCPGSYVTNSINGNATLAGVVLPAGQTIVTWTVHDASNNTATCTVTINVTDNQLPVIVNCPGDVTVFTGPARATCDQNAAWTPPTATDNCGGTVNLTSTYSPGDLFPVGTTVVTYTATDASGNVATCSFNVIVIDNTPPTFTAPANVTIYVNSSCTYNAAIGITGDVTTEADNCPLGGLQATYTDAIANGACSGTFIITRTWTLTDAHGNTTTHAQTITVSDNTAPTFTYVPPATSVNCNQGTTPAVTGQATAVDNCSGGVTVTKNDVLVPDPTCPQGGTLTRTWIATDCSGNIRTATQIITIIDQTPPVIVSVNNFTVPCPSAIPNPDPAVITATDACSTPTIVFDHEIAQFPPNVPGYCPLWVDRYYKVSDACGNYVMAVQRVTVAGPCDCSQCSNGTGFYTVDLLGQPSGTISLNNIRRDGLCCHASLPDQCVSFSIRLDEAAVGLQITVDGAVPSSQDWRVDCLPITINNGIVCIPGGTFYLFTFCKPGANRNDFKFTSLAGIVIADDANARVGCSSTLTATNTTATNTIWTSIFPGNPGDYNSYLSCTACNNPVFTPGPGAPPIIKYRVCGNLASSPCMGQSGYGCDTVTITVFDPIVVTITPDPGAYCNTVIPTLTAHVTGAGTNYTVKWYNAANGGGTLMGTGLTFTPPAGGQYSVVVTDNRTTIPCSTYIYNFFVAPDDHPPVVTPPANLLLECNNPNNTQLIQNWLASATAIDDHTTNPIITNNYNGVTQGCNTTTVVTWTATDQCNNQGTASARIIISDTQVPVWTSLNGSLDRTVECSNAAGLAAAQALQPAATDQCDPTLTYVKTSGTFVPSAQCPQRGTYTNTFRATDDCNNQSVLFTQVITITDNTAPTWTTAAGNLNRNVECSDAAALAAAQALRPAGTDNCDATVTVTKTAGPFIPGSCPNSGTYTNTFIATDDCGNISATYTQIITVGDLTGPAFTTQAQNLTVECDGSGNTTQLNNWLSNHGGAVASDACGGTITWTNNFTALSDLCGQTGAATVIFTARDVCNNVSTTQATFTIVDTQAPSIACPPNVVSQVDPTTCEATAVVLGNPTVSDMCSGPVAVGNDAPPAFPAGITVVTWTATDACGNVATCQQLVTVVDNTPPTVDCPVNVTVNAAPGLCQANVTVPAPVVTDPCPYTMTNDYTHTSNANGIYPVGTTTVTWTIEGITGNMSYCTQTVTVIDNQSPTIVCPPNVTVTAPPPDCQLQVLTIQPPQLTDNCSIALLTLTWTKTGATTGTGTGDVNGTNFNVGVTTVEYTVTDAAGHTATCQFTVTVNDQVPPTVISCPGNITANINPGTCYADVIVPAPVVQDPCMQIVTVTNSFNGTGNASGQYPVGVTTVIWTFTDVSGNTSTCQHTVSVTDNIFPTITCPGNVTAIATPPDCSVPSITIADPVYSDNCPGSVLTWTKTGATTGNGTGLVNNTTFNVGVTVVTYTVTDASGNATSCSFTVTINDQVPPTFVDCPDDMTVSNDPGQCFANIVVPQPVVTDPCGEIVSVINNYTGTNNASGQYPIGTTIVTWTITDASGNATTCNQSITVNDTEFPTISCPPNVVAIATPPDCVVPDITLGLPTYDDNCSVASITWNMTGATSGSGSGTITQYDFHVGTTVMTYTVKDASNNTTTCSFTIIVNDQVPPTVITCAPDITVNAAAGLCEANVVVTPPTVVDPCQQIVSITHNSPVGTPTDPSGIYAVGIYYITWTFTDESGNVSHCDQTITVVDNQFPIFTHCPASVLAEATPPDCEVPNITLEIPTYTDNCPNPVLTWTMTGPGGTSTGTGVITQTTFPVGTTVLTYHVTDASGNVTDCTFNVVVHDDVPPTIITCPPDITKNTDPDRCDAYISVPQPVVEDPCQEIVFITNNSIYGTSDTDASGTYPIGLTVVVWTFTDESGNTRQCSHRIVVEDHQFPVITDCPDDVTAIAAPPLCEVPAIIVQDPVYSDNCPNPILTWTKTGATTGSGTGLVNNTVFNVGVTTVTYTVTDASGNATSCSFTVTINDQVPPTVITCPPDVDLPAPANACSLDITVPAPVVSDPCNEIVTYSHDSPYGISPTNASGNYPVGSYTITWTFVDQSNNTVTCIQHIRVRDITPPALVCPPSFTVNADFEQPFATNVPIPSPTYSDACGFGSLSWVLSGATSDASPLTGMNVLTIHTLNVGVNTVTYTATDINGNVSTCFFTITVLSEPVIDCPADINTTTDPGVCSATLNPGGPTLLSGVEPIDWVYTITDAASNVLASAHCTTINLNTCIGSFTFPVGVNTITWTATNISGVDQCVQTVTVVDDEPPTVILPAPPSFCVNQIASAVYDGQPGYDADIIPEFPFIEPPFIASWRRPDWYVLNGTNELDITVTDNCCTSGNTISWIIEFEGNDPQQPDISGTGQPSTYGQIVLWGTPLNVQVTHTITYTVTDCNGNQGQPVTMNIIITPRPNVIKIY